MSSTRARIAVIAACIGAGFCVVLLHLWFLMVQQHDVWARRSRDNRWTFRSVPSQRGALLDRRGRMLAHDEPSMQLSVYYRRFRLYHPIGAAVHGATGWAALQPGREGTRYAYEDGALGPLAAAEHLLSMPARVLRPGVVAKDVAAELGFAVTTVLSASSGMPRKRVYAALRTAGSAPGLVACGDVLPMPREQVMAGFSQTLASLRRFEAELGELRRARRAEVGPSTGEQEGLMARLDSLRRKSLARERHQWVETVGKGDQQQQIVRTGSLSETIRSVFDDHVPFEFAARLRVGAEQHPGLEVYPSIRRVRELERGTALGVLLGDVRNVDRAQTDNAWVDRFLAREMPATWLEEFTPDTLAATAEEREQLQQEARDGYVYALLRRERRGTVGIERAFDDQLMGRLGMRLVEHDSRRREQLLWSNLRVEAGEDVRLSIDVDLQDIAERLVGGAQADIAARHIDPDARGKVKAALAVVDAISGDVLAFAGAPITSPYAGSLPGLTWSSNGSLGSVVKPLMLVEQLRREAVGEPNRPMASFAPCAGKYVFGNQRLGCGHAHGERGRDPVDAIAESCNSFFFQAAEGFGAEGVAQALRRFGLCPPTGDDDPLFVCWQSAVGGMPYAKPRVQSARSVPMRAVGYGVEASPLSVARAYAALATGVLPSLGLQAGEARPVVRLDGVAAELAVVREGLRDCVDKGTAKDILLLRHFGVFGKTGTAEVGEREENNAWFAGFLPGPGGDGVQLCFCAVVYWVPDGVHGDEAAGELVARWLAEVEASPDLGVRYLPLEGGR